MRDEAKLRTREVSNKQAGWNKKVGLNFLSFLKTSRMDTAIKYPARLFHPACLLDNSE